MKSIPCQEQTKSAARDAGQIKPSDFTSAPMGSVAQNCESEIVASNIMAIRKRLGDKWDLTAEEYRRERKKDGEFTEREMDYFSKVYPLIKDEIGAITFAPAWTLDARKAKNKTI